VSKRLDQFVKSYPKTWDRCLEAFMVPLRISLPPQADYVPAYLTFNRYVHIVRLHENVTGKMMDFMFILFRSLSSFNTLAGYVLFGSL